MIERTRFPWVSVSAIVSCFVVLVIAWVRIPEGKSSRGEAIAKPVLQLTRLDAAFSSTLVEQLAAYDPTPLFLPSGMSSGASPFEDEASGGLASPFRPIAPELTKTSPLLFPTSVALPRDPVAGLGITERVDDPLAMGRSDDVGAALVSRVGRVEAIDSKSGRTVHTMDLHSLITLADQDWQPLELLGAISRSGMVGGLVVSTSSGAAEIDDFFCAYLKDTIHVGAHLPEGFYVFRIGP